MSIESFHRFESQKCVGRNYPWTSMYRVETRRRKFRRTTSVPYVPTPKDEIKSKLLDFDERIANSMGSNEDTKTLNINPNNFDSSNERKTIGNLDPYLSNFTDDDKMKSQDSIKVVNVNIEQPPVDLSYDTVDNEKDSERDSKVKLRRNVPDDELIETIKDESPASSPSTNLEEDGYDVSPELPPPPIPTSSFPYIQTLTRLSTFKDMLIYNTEELIKNNVPRLPPGEL